VGRSRADVSLIFDSSVPGLSRKDIVRGFPFLLIRTIVAALGLFL